MTAEIETVILLQFTVPFPADFLVLNFQDDSLIDSRFLIIDVGDFEQGFKDSDRPDTCGRFVIGKSLTLSAP